MNKILLPTPVWFAIMKFLCAVDESDNRIYIMSGIFTVENIIM